jgi:hypothetical protein
MSTGETSVHRVLMARRTTIEEVEDEDTLLPRIIVTPAALPPASPTHQSRHASVEEGEDEDPLILRGAATRGLPHVSRNGTPRMRCVNVGEVFEAAADISAPPAVNEQGFVIDASMHRKPW